MTGLLNKPGNYAACCPPTSAPHNQLVEPFLPAFKNEGLRRILVNLFPAQVPVWFVMLIMAPARESSDGLFEGSCLDFGEHGRTLAKISAAKSPSIPPSKKSSKTTAPSASGSWTAMERRADIVVRRATASSTLFNLLGDRHTSPQVRDCYKNWQHLVPIVTLSFGVAASPDEPSLNSPAAEKPLTIGNVTINGFPVRISITATSFRRPAKPSSSRCCIWIGDFWEKPGTTATPTKPRRNASALEALERLETHYPGITAKAWR